MSKAAFKDKQLSSQPLKPRPRYYNEPHLSSSTTQGIVTESGHSNSPKPQELVDYSKNWSVSHNKTPQITLDQRREAVTQALRLSRAVRDWEAFFKQVMGVDGLIVAALTGFWEFYVWKIFSPFYLGFMNYIWSLFIIILFI